VLCDIFLPFPPLFFFIRSLTYSSRAIERTTQIRKWPSGSLKKTFNKKRIVVTEEGKRGREGEGVCFDSNCLLFFRFSAVSLLSFTPRAAPATKQMGLYLRPTMDRVDRGGGGGCVCVCWIIEHRNTNEEEEEEKKKCRAAGLLI
jgi:hypothetical protein